jgi:nicotinate-nucleotide adenylyltransferase
MVPAGAPWQKQHRFIAPADDRVAMVEAGIEGVAGLELSRLEVDRPGPTYTADTVEALRAAHPIDQLFLIVGADAAAEIDTWDRVVVLRRETTLVVVTRAGEPEETGPPGGWRDLRRVQIPALEISSSDLRQRAANGDRLEGLMPPAAIRCLRERGLYAGRG